MLRLKIVVGARVRMRDEVRQGKWTEIPGAITDGAVDIMYCFLATYLG